VLMEGGIRRLTFPLPMELDHVHAYLLPSTDGWTLVDTGFGAPGLAEHWRDLLSGLDRPVTRIVITHFHPDHVGGATDAVEATGAPVFQGGLDYEQCVRVWGSGDWNGPLETWYERHGVPREVIDELEQLSAAMRPFVRFVRDPEPLEPGDEVDGWAVHAFPGHADGHICLVKDGLMIAGDHLLPRISPQIGLYPEARPDPLGDYLASLRRTVELAPRVAFPGHGDPVLDPAGRAAELIEHHRRRLDETEAALGPEPQSAYRLSFALFGGELSLVGRRFALAETLSHLERLAFEGRAARVGDDGSLSYTAI
jgi:glyoxylase-like metal-dependent hydrolase (beta-lactamase superfamily II)